MQSFVGVDGGGTRATAVVVNDAGLVLARVDGGPALVSSIEPAAGAAALADLTARALNEAQVSEYATALCCALAGAGRDDERRALQGALLQVAPARRVVITTDAEAALFDAFGDGPGILLIAGTGSIAWARATDSRIARAGGWGVHLGDEGSGYALGSAALKASVRAHDGRAEATALLEAVLRHTGLASPEDLIAWVARASKASVAALAPLVIAAAAQGDRIARALVQSAADELALHVAALYRRLQPWSAAPVVALSGGLIARGGALHEAVRAAIGALTPPLEIRDEPVDAARGAALLAQRSL